MVVELASFGAELVTAKMMLKASEDVLLTATDDARKLKGWAATEADLKRMVKGEVDATNAILKELTEKELKQLITSAAIRNRIAMHFKDLKFYKQGDEYVVMYEGEKLFAHSNASYLKEYVENVFKQRYAAKALKKLKDLAKERRLALEKWRKKLTTEFNNHLTGDVMPEGLDTTFGEFLFIGTKGQGGHFINRFINLIKIEIPPGIKGIDQLLPDTPFIAKIEVVSLQGKIFPKDAFSSMFPRNWSKERIQEEVAWVYENTVAKNKGLNPDSIKKIFRQFKFKDSNNQFEILIEVDNSGVIVNSYPIL